jgi:thiol:disulfide interchange protein
MKKAIVVAVLAFVLTAVSSLAAQSSTGVGAAESQAEPAQQHKIAVQIQSTGLPAADALLSQAESSAAQQHKLVLIVFHASWCGPCRALDRYLDSAEVRPIINRYFVVVRLAAMEEAAKHPERNNPGANDLLQKLGGGDGVPFFAFLDTGGRPIVNSIAPKAGNVGFPVERHEIDWFMKMLAKAVPAMTRAEAKVLARKLRS